MPSKQKTKTYYAAERALHDYWKAKLPRTARSVWAPLVDGVVWHGRASSRGRGLDARAIRGNSAEELASILTGLILNGFPLSRCEYYLALGFGLLLGDTPYEEFFRTHWHETKTEFGYGPAPKES